MFDEKDTLGVDADDADDVDDDDDVDDNDNGEEGDSGILERLFSFWP